MTDTHQNKLHYLWVPRSEVVYIQAIVDASEGLARVRTERHEGDRSLLMFMVQPSRYEELLGLLRHMESEVSGKFSDLKNRHNESI